jgi:hypothetical protein
MLPFKRASKSKEDDGVLGVCTHLLGDLPRIIQNRPTPPLLLHPQAPSLATPANSTP